MHLSILLSANNSLLLPVYWGRGNNITITLITTKRERGKCRNKKKKEKVSEFKSEAPVKILISHVLPKSDLPLLPKLCSRRSCSIHIVYTAALAAVGGSASVSPRHPVNRATRTHGKWFAAMVPSNLCPVFLPPRPTYIFCQYLEFYRIKSGPRGSLLEKL